MPSVKTNFSLKDKDVERIQQSILKCGNSSEQVINDYLHNVAGEKITKSITRFIPVSKKGKKHAKFSNWSEQDNYNLAVGISNSLKGKRGTSFYYLYYVIKGEGTSKPSKRKTGQGGVDFMTKGMDQEYNNVVNGLVNELDRNIEKEMKL